MHKNIYRLHNVLIHINIVNRFNSYYRKPQFEENSHQIYAIRIPYWCTFMLNNAREHIKIYLYYINYISSKLQRRNHYNKLKKLK